MKPVKLQSCDGQIFDVDIKIAQGLGPVADVLYICGEQGLEKQIIPLSNVKSRILSKIIYWLEYHANHIDEIVLGNSLWGEAYIQSLTTEDLVEMIRASNYLNVQMLFDMACKYAAEHIEQKLKLQHDFLANIQLANENSSPEKIRNSLDNIAECSDLAWTNRIYKKNSV